MVNSASGKKLTIEHLSKSFDKKTILEDVSFDVKKGEFLSILGSSGCGKTTLLRILIGIEKADEGHIFKDGIEISKAHPSARKMGMVFQNYALFPNMNVYNNIAFALKGKVKKDEIKTRVEAALKMVNMLDFANKKPSKLSGGQQQRVALARVFVLNPDIILFDEPMAALDAEIRASLRDEIKSLQKKLNITMIYVTHDQEEAFTMSDRIMVMKDGKIEQIGTPNEIYNTPKTVFVKNFVKKRIDERINFLKEKTDEK